MSLSALARRAGVAKATLSSLEAGAGNPTVTTLEAIASGLQVPVTALVVEEPDVRVVRVVTSGTDDRFVDSFHPSGPITVYDVRLGAGDRVVYPPHAAGTTERLLVVAGRLVAGPLGEEIAVGPDEFVTFPADREHVYAAGEVTRATLIVGFPAGRPGDEPIHGRSRR